MLHKDTISVFFPLLYQHNGFWVKYMIKVHTSKGFTTFCINFETFLESQK